MHPTIRFVAPETSDRVANVEIEIIVCRGDGSYGAALIEDDGSETFRKLTDYAKMAMMTAEAQECMSYWIGRPDRVSPYAYDPMATVRPSQSA